MVHDRARGGANARLARLTPEMQARIGGFGLSLSESECRTLVEESPLGVTVVVDGRFAYVNAAAATLVGAGSPAEVIGQPITTFLLPADVPAAQRRIEEILGGHGRSGEYRTVRRLDGSTAVVLASAVGAGWNGRPA